MKNIFATVSAVIFALSVNAQELSSSDKIIKVEELPEYVVVNCDNVAGILRRNIRIRIQAKGSQFEKKLDDLEAILDEEKYLFVINQTDLLNAMAKLGFDYVNAFTQGENESISFGRSGFVFRKKEKYRN